jgi:hypothetical protein
MCVCLRVCQDSVVSIATLYELESPGIESRWGARFSAPVQTAPGAHPASYTMGTGSLSRGKAVGAWRLPPTPSSAEVKARADVDLYSHSGTSWPVLGWTLPLPLPSFCVTEISTVLTLRFLFTLLMGLKWNFIDRALLVYILVSKFWNCTKCSVYRTPFDISTVWRGVEGGGGYVWWRMLWWFTVTLEACSSTSFPFLKSETLCSLFDINHVDTTMS